MPRSGLANPNAQMLTMYGLDMTIDLSFLIGREAIQIAIGQYQVIFAFDEDVRISVESEFRHISPDGDVSTWQPRAPQTAAATLRLLGAKVEKVSGQKDGTLKLTFSGGDTLTILDSSKDYQSYDISCPGRTIVV
jgi:Family of unknown function (DUF6188)